MATYGALFLGIICVVVWRQRGMEVMIYIPSSSNLEGRLRVLWAPRFGDSTAYTGDPTHRLANVAIDFKGSTKTLIQVDYAQQAPCLNQGVGVLSDQFNNQNTNGKLVLYVDTPLKTPRVDGLNSTRILVMIRPMQDMRFGGVSNYVWAADQTIPPFFLNRIVYQAGDEHVDEVEQVVYPLVAGKKDYPLTDMLWGEEILSCRAMWQKFSPYFVLGYGLDDRHNILFPHCPVFPWNSLPVIDQGKWVTTQGPTPKGIWTYASHYTHLFSGVRGSTRVKLITHQETDVEPYVAAYSFPRFSSELATGNLTTYYNPALSTNVPNLSTGVILPPNGEAVFPYYGQFKYIQPTVWKGMGNSLYGYDHVDGLTPLVLGNNLTNSTIVHFAYGPDVAIIHFRRVPGLAFGAAPPFE